MKYLKEINEVLWEMSACEEVSPEDDLKADLGLDSLSIVAFIVGLEEKFGIMFDDGDLNPCDLIKVRDISELLEKTL